MGLVQIFFVCCLATVFGHAFPPGNELHPDVVPKERNEGELEVEPNEHWVTSAQESITSKLSQPRVETKAKNLILMIGDGMGLSTVTAARILKGQRSEEGLFGEEGELYMEKFPYVGTSKTFCSDVQVADSACTSTAFSSGYKGNVATIGVSPAVNLKNCSASLLPENQFESVLEWAQKRNMATGIVTTTAITDASPAGAYAHIADRNWENDKTIRDDGEDPKACHDIARQLIQGMPGKNLNVILGAGRQHFLRSDQNDTETGQPGRREDGRDLLQEWSDGHGGQEVITLRSQLLEYDTAKDHILGLFAYENLAYEDERETANDPRLSEMVEVAVKILSRNPNGFYLFVEGGNIDKAHHMNEGQRALVETLEFDDAIRKADELTPDKETLIVVSADHSHLLTISGSPPRGNDIFGFAGTDVDGMPATTLSYINGPGYRKPDPTTDCTRRDMSTDDTENIHYQQMTSYPKSSASHAGEDVLIFAKGPFAHLLTGINDQTFIAHVMKHANVAGGVGGQATVSVTIVAVVALINYVI